MRLLRWADRLSEYQFDVCYKPGSDNAVADLLSRSEASPTLEHEDQHSAANELYIRTIFGNTALSTLSLKDIATATTSDDELNSVVRRCTTGWLNADARNSILFAYYKVRVELSIAQGVIFKGEQAIVPESLRL